VIIIVVSAILFNEGLGRNKMMGSAIAITGTFLYSLTSKKGIAGITELFGGGKDKKA